MAVRASLPASFGALFGALLVAFTSAPAVAAPAGRSATVRPVVVELYTSQGCSACAKADGLLEGLAKGGGVLPLTFAVDYWDYLGWTDTFADSAFSDRQRAYMRRLDQRDVYTPQAIIDGRTQAAGVHPDKVRALVKAAGKARAPAPRMGFYAARFVRIEAGRAPRGGTDVWLVRYEAKPQAVEIKEGENRGETVTYVNAVRELTRLGGWTGARRTLEIPAGTPGLKTAILLQGAKGGPILAVLQK